jgi:hypothetical protein
VLSKAPQPAGSSLSRHWTAAGLGAAWEAHPAAAIRTALLPIPTPSVCVGSPVPAPAVAQLQLIQFSGAAACGGRSWVYDCAQAATAQIMNGDVKITPAPSATALAAAGAGAANNQARAAAAPAGTMGTPAPIPVAAAGSAPAPGAGGAVSASSVLGMGGPAAAAGAAPAGHAYSAAPMAVESGGYGRRLSQLGPAAGFGAPAPIAAGRPGAPAPLGAAAPLGAESGPATVNYVPPPLFASPLGRGAAASQCSAAPGLQGVATSASGLALLVPGWKDLVPAAAYGNDTLLIQFPLQGCSAVYRVVAGSLLGLSPPEPARSSAGAGRGKIAAAAWTAAAATAAALALAF